MIFKIKGKLKENPLVGTYFKVEGRYYKVHHIDKNTNYIHMFGENYNSTTVSEHFGTTKDNWNRRIREGKYIIVSESEVPESVLNYKVTRKYE